MIPTAWARSFAAEAWGGKNSSKSMDVDLAIAFANILDREVSSIHERLTSAEKQIARMISGSEASK